MTGDMKYVQWKMSHAFHKNVTPVKHETGSTKDLILLLGSIYPKQFWNSERIVHYFNRDSYSVSEFQSIVLDWANMDVAMYTVFNLNSKQFHIIRFGQKIYI